MPSVRLSKGDYERLRTIEKLIAENGIKVLEGLREVCPKCGGLMDGIRVSAERVRCPNCGYEEKGVTLAKTRLGTIVGLALGALVTWINEMRRPIEAKRIDDSPEF